MNIDYQLIYDLNRQLRPLAIAAKDVGCSEFPHDTPVRPIATEKNTGPAYLWNTSSVFLRINLEGFGAVALNSSLSQFDIGTEVTLTALPSENYFFIKWTQDAMGTSNPQTIIMDSHKEVTAHFSLDPTDVNNLPLEKKILMKVFPNPIVNEINLTFTLKNKAQVDIELFNNDGKKIKSLLSQNFPSGNHLIVEAVKNLPSGIYYLYLKKQTVGVNTKEVQVIKIVK